jgi:heavy metal translocating P-type ATPase
MLNLMALAIGGGVIAAVALMRRRRAPLIAVPTPSRPAVDPKQPPPVTQRPALLERARTRFAQLDEQYQALIQTHLDPWLADRLRDRQMQVLARGGRRDLSPYEKQANRALALGVVALGLSAVAWLTALPLIPIVIAIGLYSVLPMFQEAYRIAVKERRLSVLHLSLGYGIGLWLSGYYLTGMMGLLFGALLWKVQLLTQVVTRHSLTHILGEQPYRVWVILEGVEVEIPFAELRVGDILVLDAGQLVPVDGVIVHGTATLDQHRLTGESQPAEKEVGDAVLAATLMLGGRIHVRVEKTGAETAAAQIGEILNRTVERHEARLADQFKSVEHTLVPTLAGGALGWIVAGPMTALAVVGCNYLLGTIPFQLLTLLNGLSLGSQRGILIKDGRALERLPAIDTLIFDKTGTLTLERPQVVQLHVCPGWDEEEVLRLAAAAEYRQTHPIAQAIREAAATHQLAVPLIDKAHYAIGSGLTVKLDGRQVRVGSQRFLEMEGLRLPAHLRMVQHASQGQGHSVVFVAVEETMVGAIELAATLRPETQAVVQWLQHQGFTLYILSGDQEAPTRKLAAELGMSGYFANTLPEQKAQRVKQLQHQGHRVCFIGDGINDAVALRQADVSISLRGATTVATDAAQVVLMEDHLEQIQVLLELARAHDRKLRTFARQAKGFSLAGAAGVLLLPPFKFRLVQMLGIVHLAIGVRAARRPLLDKAAEPGSVSQPRQRSSV